MDPNFVRAHLFLAEAYQQEGMFEQAVDEFDKAFALIGVPKDEASKFLDPIKAAYKSSGAKGYWRTLAEFAETRPPKQLGPGPAPPTLLAALWARAGETEKAFALLEKGYEQRDQGMIRLKDPVYDPIKSDPRYKDLLRRVGLPES
jgi:tetratricopeptide (TPR) repeat protein